MRCFAIFSGRLLLVILFLVGGVARGQSPVINELMANNTRTLSDEMGDFDDWIEIHNPSAQPVDIGGMYLTDRLSNPTKWRIPRSEEHTS